MRAGRAVVQEKTMLDWVGSVAGEDVWFEMCDGRLVRGWK